MESEKSNESCLEPVSGQAMAREGERESERWSRDR